MVVPALGVLSRVAEEKIILDAPRDVAIRADERVVVARERAASCGATVRIAEVVAQQLMLKYVLQMAG